jgi:predicted nuclease with TOPRIM domain
LITENKKLKEDLNNLLKSKDIDIKNQNNRIETESNEYKKKLKKVVKDNNTLNDKKEKSKKDIYKLKNNKSYAIKKEDIEKHEELNKVINDLKFEINQ